MMEIRLLGPVEVEIDGVAYAPSRAAERCVLATLALNPGRPVPVGTLIEHVWGSHPPVKAEQTVTTYVRAVRRMIGRAGGARERLANRRLGGYQLDVEPQVVDYRRFTDLRSAARARHRDGDPDRAVESLERALALWRGEALADVGGNWADGHRLRMMRERLETMYTLLDLHLRAGRASVMATRATELAYDDPTDKTLGLAIRGLAASGQRALIPAFLARAAERMRDSRDVSPGTEVVDLARQLARQPAGAEPAPEASARGHLVTITATNCVNVYQTTGDQYISEHQPAHRNRDLG